MAGAMPAIFSMKLVFTSTGDYIDILVTNHEFVEFWLDQINKGFDPIFELVTHNIDFDNIELLVSCLKNTNDILKKFKIEPLMDHDVDFNDQNNLNVLHERWVKLQHQHSNIVNALNKMPSEFAKNFHNVNKYIHKIEDAKQIVYEKYNDNRTTWQIKNPFDTDILGCGTWNVELHYQNLGRSLYDKWHNMDNNVHDEDTNNFTHVGSRVIINVALPYTTALPDRYVEFCKIHRTKPINPVLPLGNFDKYETKLTDLRNIIFRNVRQNNRISFEI
jgi:hypothetical protein